MTASRTYAPVEVSLKMTRGCCYASDCFFHVNFPIALKEHSATRATYLIDIIKSFSFRKSGLILSIYQHKHPTLFERMSPFS